MYSNYKIGLALGSGAARGLSHIGIIYALAEMGIEPDIICGTSIGSLVGASFVTGKLATLEKWSTSLTKLETARFFEINASMNGFVNEDRFREFLHANVASEDIQIEQLDKTFAAVSTDLHSGKEIWTTEGALLPAVWASVSLPGLFPAIKIGSKWLVDGGLVNPVPVSVCRALGADIVIAVNLNANIVGKHFQKSQKKEKSNMGDKLSAFVREYTGDLFVDNEEEDAPNILDTIAGSVNIVQDRITRSRMAGDPPDMTLVPRLSHMGLLEFYRANEAIAEGRNCIKRLSSEIERILK